MEDGDAVLSIERVVKCFDGLLELRRVHVFLEELLLLLTFRQVLQVLLVVVVSNELDQLLVGDVAQVDWLDLLGIVTCLLLCFDLLYEVLDEVHVGGWLVRL